MKTTNLLMEEQAEYGNDWERIAERRMIEINRLRKLLQGDAVDLELMRKRNRELIEALAKPQYYALLIWGDVDPILSASFNNPQARDEEAKRMHKEDEEENGCEFGGMYWLNYEHGLAIVGAYSSNFLDEEEESDTDPKHPYMNKNGCSNLVQSAYNVIKREQDNKAEEPEVEYNKFHQIAYIERMQNSLANLGIAVRRLSMDWEKGSEYGLFMNEYLADGYPFYPSFDDLSLEIDLWIEKSFKALKRKKMALQGYSVPDNDDKVEEPPAPYYTPQEAEGKWVCAFDTMCGGWDCVRYGGGDRDNFPVLYNSQKEVEEDDFFDGDDDFAIPATEFIEGRKASYTNNGIVITGTPIVKGYQIVERETKKVEQQ